MSFQTLSDNFIASLKKIGYSLHLEKFEVHDLRDRKQGRGLIALRDIEEDEELFSIPRSAILNISTCSLREEQKQKLEELDSWEALILVILYERSLGKGSRWFGYFQVLPFEETFNNLMFWDESELKMLEPSLVVERIGKHDALSMYDKLFPKVITDLGIEMAMKEITVEKFHKVASTIMSYSFDVEDPIHENETSDEEDDEEDEEESFFKSMVPLADTLNADTNLCNAHLTYTPEALVMRSTSAIRKGEQIYNTYANHPNAEILRRYGYVEFGGSKHDFGEVRFESILEYFVEQYEFPQRLVTNIVDIITDNEYLLGLTEGQNIILDSYDCYVDGEIYPELILLLQIFTVLGMVNIQDKKLLKRMPKSELEKFLNRNIKKNYQLIEQKKLMKSTGENFKRIIERRIDQYPQIEEESIKEDYNDRSSMAKCVLLSELKSLRNSKENALKGFELVEDEKMIKNVLKRKLEEEAEKKERKRKK